MLFHSFRFLLFFPCVFFLYWGVPHRFRKYLLLAASYYFYMCWKPEFIVLILASTCIDYVCGLAIQRFRGNRRKEKLFLAVSLTMNLGLLFFFKYFNFFGETVTALCRAVSILFSVPALQIILPVGISFYTFQTLSYTIDVYRGKLEAERDFVTFALFVSFFPQLVAGPIEKAADLLPQLKKEHVFSYEDAAYGLKLMAWGFFKKLVIADRLATLLVDPVYGNPPGYQGGAMLIATAAFAFQIYCDFGGYSDIARGCARTMGVELMVNFQAPYLAESMTAFWRRWHISLTDWFRTYIYIPLGGNRKGKRQQMLFTMLVFSLSGLWHGADWTFVVWGVLHGCYLCSEQLYREVRGGAADRPHNILCRMLLRLKTLLLASFAWVFFRAASMADALYVLQYSLSGIRDSLTYAKLAFGSLYPGAVAAAVLVFALALLFLFDLVNEKVSCKENLTLSNSLTSLRESTFRLESAPTHYKSSMSCLMKKAFPLPQSPFSASVDTNG